MRATLDKLISWTGLLLAGVLLVAGGLLTWASIFVGNQVHDQLAAQKIVMPSEKQLETPAQKDALLKYAGQTMTTGDQARAYADQYILVHMGPKTYAELGDEQRAAKAKVDANPNDQAAKDELAKVTADRESNFKGNTLRGLLLYGYAFATIGKVAGYAAIAAFIGAAIFLILGLLGLRHAAKVTETTRTTGTTGTGATEATATT